MSWIMIECYCDCYIVYLCLKLKFVLIVWGTGRINCDLLNESMCIKCLDSQQNSSGNCTMLSEWS